MIGAARRDEAAVENVDTTKTEERKDLQAAVEHSPEVTEEANGLDRSLADDGSARNVSQNTEEETNQSLLADVEEVEVDNQPRKAVSDMIDSDAEDNDSEEDPQGLLQRWILSPFKSVARSRQVCICIGWKQLSC